MDSTSATSGPSPWVSSGPSCSLSPDQVQTGQWRIHRDMAWHVVPDWMALTHSIGWSPHGSLAVSGPDIHEDVTGLSRRNGFVPYSFVPSCDRQSGPETPTTLPPPQWPLTTLRHTAHVPRLRAPTNPVQPTSAHSNQHTGVVPSRGGSRSLRDFQAATGRPNPEQTSRTPSVDAPYRFPENTAAPGSVPSMTVLRMKTACGDTRPALQHRGPRHAPRPPA